MKITTTQTEKREIEIPIPSFFKEKPIYEGSETVDVLGVLDEDTCVRAFITPKRTDVSNNAISVMDSDIAYAYINWLPITEDEFFTHYNNAMESLSLTPKLNIP